MDLAGLLVGISLLTLVSAPPLALGWRMQESLGGQRSARLSLLLSAGLGFGAASLTVAAIGLAGWLGRGELIGLLAILAAAAGRRGWDGVGRSFLAGAKGVRERARDLSSAGLAGIVVGMLGLAWIVSCAPLSGSDAMAYHFAIPKLYAGAGRIFEIPWSLYSYLLGTAHMLILLGLGLSGSGLALGLCWLGAVFTALATLELADRRMPGRWAALAVAAVISAPLLFWQMSAAGSPDLWTTFFTLMTAISLLEFRAESGASWAAAGGIFAGLAAGCKYPEWSVVIIGTVLLTFWEKGIRKGVLLFGTAAALTGSWRLLLNAGWTGNPVHPFLAELFSRSRVSSLSAHATAVTARAAGYSLSPAALLAYPVRLTLQGHDWGVGEMFGPIILTLLPVVFVRAWRERDFDLLLFAGAFTAFNAATSQMARFLLPVFPIFIVLSLEALVWLRSGLHLRKAQGAALASVLASLGWALASDVAYSRPFLPAALQPARRETFLRRWASNYSISEWINQRLGSASGRVMVFYRHVYYLDIPYVSGDPEHSTPMDAATIRVGDDLAAALSRLSVAWVAEDDDFPPLTRAAFNDLVRCGALRKVDSAQVEDLAGDRGMNRYRQVRLSLWRFESNARESRNETVP